MQRGLVDEILANANNINEIEIGGSYLLRMFCLRNGVRTKRKEKREGKGRRGRILAAFVWAKA